MVDFMKMLSPKTQERIARKDKYFADRLVEFRNYTTEELLARIEYYMENMSIPRKYSPTAPVYDAVFYYVVVPEMARRLRCLPKL